MARESLLPRTHLLLRFTIACCIGLIVFGISLQTGRRNAESSMAWNEQRTTQLELKSLSQTLTAYQQMLGSCPSNFDQLLSMTNDFLWMPRGRFIDNWGHALVFSNEGTNCLIISYGRDGKPGGIGVDCDLTTKTPQPREAVPTFSQFFENERLHAMTLTVFVCGFLAAFLSFITVRVPDLTRKGLAILALSLTATTIGAVFVAGIITILHIPSGH